MRTRVIEIGEDGSETFKRVSAFGFIVRLADLPGDAPSDVRRRFLRHCKRASIIVGQTEDRETGERRYGCEFGEVNYSKRTGSVHGDTTEVATAYQVMGGIEPLLDLLEQEFIGEFHVALSVRAPVLAQGSGPEKVRPPLGSAFGKPEQVAATAVALARQGDAVRTAHRKAWGEMG
jgi:hypothetical protein